MTNAEREIKVMPITIRNLFPVGEVTLLKAVGARIPNIIIEERETSGQIYRPMITSANQLKYFNRSSVVPEGYINIAITINPTSLPTFWHKLEEARNNIKDNLKTP